MIKKDDILVGIVTYNPKINDFVNSVKLVSKQTKHIVIVDNGSNNVVDFFNMVNVKKVIRNDRNFGIAKALSQVMDYAILYGYKWVLTLDQDSVIYDELINSYIKYVNKYDDGTFAIFTCLRKDKNFHDDNNMFQKNDVEEKLLCITSGTLTSVEKYKMVSGYDINFFIDYVDYDLCYQFRELGYKILRINFIGILHEAGKGRNAKFFLMI